MQETRAARTCSKVSTTGPQRRKTGQGFTLIELLVVVAIIGILCAIAIPRFSEYRNRALNALVAHDARNAASAQEAYFIDNNSYAADCGSLPGFTLSEGVSCTATGGASAFTITTTHSGTGYSCTWRSDPGTENLVCS